MCDYLERNDEDQLTILDLVSKMRGYLFEDSSAPYGNQYLKENVKGHYGDSIYVAEGDGLNNIVTMREKHPKYYVITSKALMVRMRKVRSVLSSKRPQS